MRNVAMPAVLLLALLSVDAVAQSTDGRLYQWKDANGVTHFSQTPPPRGAYRTRTVNAQAPAAAPASAAPAEPPACVRARANLALLQSDQPLRLEGEDTAELSAEQRNAQTELAEAAIRANCPATR